MEITKSFVVKAPAAAVWEFLTDPYRVGRCLPGAAITDKVDDQTYAGTITIKVGPVTASYRGKMRFERLDPAAMEADIAASGQETKGKGGADMRMKSRVVAKGPAETEVTVVSDVNVMGVLAQFGRGMIQDVSDQLFQKFTDGMRRELETPPAAAAPVAVEAAPVEAAASGAPAAAIPSPLPSPAPVLSAPPPPASEDVLDVGSLGAKAAGRAAGRILRGPIFWIAVILLVFLIFWMTHR
ncbi:MAG TPA: SRPBCC family protein [Thermoanaerobaculia bacterium]|nr:SRPBCC family protein [Thermoanaerobaculia bacterium]